MAALSTGAVGLGRRRLDIDRTVAEADGRLIWKALKDYERRSVPFPDFVADDLSALMLGKGGDDLVFSAPGGGVLRVSLWRPRVFNPARDSLKGFPKVTPHDLRHTAASLVVSAGGNVLALARMLGHEDPSMTLKVYADLFDTDLDALAEVLTKARRAALKQPSTASADSKSAGENVPGTLEQTLQVFYQSFSWSGWRDSNPRPLRPERSALPSCATPRLKPRQPIAPAHWLAKPQAEG